MKSKAKKSKFHLLVYVEGCSPKIKRFRTLKALNEFVTKYNKKYPDQTNGDNWIDYMVTNVTGEIRVFDHSCLTVENVA